MCMLCGISHLPPWSRSVTVIVTDGLVSFWLQGTCSSHDLMLCNYVGVALQPGNISQTKISAFWENKANLRDLIATTGLMILPKSVSLWPQLQFDRWSRKTIGNLFHAPRSNVCHFIATREDNFELPHGNAEIRAKSSIFHSVWPRNFDGWPRKTIWHLFYAISSSVHHFKVINKFNPELQSVNAQWGSKLGFFLSRVTLKFGT